MSRPLPFLLSLSFFYAQSGELIITPPAAAELSTAAAASSLWAGGQGGAPSQIS